jgi:integrase
MKLRESTGGAYEKRGQFFMRVTVAPQQRRAELLPWCTSLAAAKERAGVVQVLVSRLRAAGEVAFIEKVVELGATADAATLASLGEKVSAITAGHFDRLAPAKGKGGPVTFRTFAERWTSGDLARLHPDHIEPKASVQDDVERFEKHIFPHVEDVPLVDFTRAHADLVMAKLPPTMKRSTRRHVAQLVNRVLHLAVFVDVLKHHPLPRGWLPKMPRADSIGKESLLPSEEARLLAGYTKGGDPISLAYRVAYLFLHREGMRKGEAKALTWADLDLERGMVSLDENKTDRPRSWVLDPGVAAVLVKWKAQCGAVKPVGAVFADIAWDALARVYRAHCEAVGIDRARLFQKKANKLQLRAHDMRAFFITSGMFAGRDALWITDRSGHTTLGMLRTYERDVRRWRELGEAPVDAAIAIPELAAANTAAGRGGKTVDSKVGESVSTRQVATKAEVAEWQTQRIQNPPSLRA